MVGIDGTLGSLTATTHRAGVTQNNELVVTSTYQGLAIARGLVPGMSVINKFGASPDIDQNELRDLWDYKVGSIYNYQTSGIPLYMVSTSLSDTAVLEVVGLNENWQPITVTGSLFSGRTPVRVGSYTGSDYLFSRVFRVLNKSPDSLTGNVSIYESGTATAGSVDNPNFVKAFINSGLIHDNQTEMGLYTIPSGVTGYMTNAYGNISNNVAAVIEYALYARPSGGVFNLKYRNSIDSNATSSFQHFFNPPLKFTPQTDIKIQIKSDTNNTAVAGGFDIILVDGS